MHISSVFHIAQYVFLQVADGLEGVWDVLVLLDVSDDISRFGAFGEVDQVGLFDDGGYAVFDEGQVCEVDAWMKLLVLLANWSGCGTNQRRVCKEDWPDAALLYIHQSSWCYASTSSFAPVRSAFGH